jgi:hypothetical protein
MLIKRKLRLTALLLISAILFATLFAGTASAVVVQNTRAWFWGSDTDAASVTAADVDGEGGIEIVSGGYYNDGTRWVAQLAVWNGSTMALENVKTWYWTADTQIASVAAGDVDGDGGVEVVSAGAYFDGTRWVAQLAVWNGSTMALENVKTWYWTADTQIASVALGDIDSDGGIEIVTGGSYYDNIRDNAQLVVWNGSTMALENVKTWYWTSNTYINSVAIGNVEGDGAVEIVTGGKFLDGTRYNAQLTVQPGATLIGNTGANWYWTSHTNVGSVVISNLVGTGNLIVTGGAYSDLTRSIAQLVVWG